MTVPGQDFERECVVYLRKSKGKAGIARQRKENQAHADRLGWRIVEEFAEPDTTAFAKLGEDDAPRPEYDRMLAFLQADDRDPSLGIIAWHVDRLSRNSGEVRPLAAVCAKGGHLVETPRSGRYDLSLPNGRKRFRDDVSDAEGEVDHLIERVDSQKVEAASEGRWLGGRRPFGFKRDGVRHKKAEAELIRQAYEDVLAGVSLRSIARRWNEAGVATTGPAPRWTTGSLRVLLSRPRNAGLMKFRGEVIGPASWEPIVDEATWRSAVRLFTDPARRATPGPERRWLGSGLYVCGVCEEPRMSVHGTGGRGRRYTHAYRCHVSREAGPLDAYVTERVVARLSRPDARTLLVDDRRDDVAELEARLLGLREELDGWRADAASGAVTRLAFRPVEQRLLREIAQAQEALVRPDRALILADLIEADDVAAVWESLSLDRQRAALGALYRVTVHPAPRGRPKGHPAGVPYLHRESVEFTRLA